jgi:hypothetical protein
MCPDYINIDAGEFRSTALSVHNRPMSQVTENCVVGISGMTRFVLIFCVAFLSLQRKFGQSTSKKTRAKYFKENSGKLLQRKLGQSTSKKTRAKYFKENSG